MRTILVNIVLYFFGLLFGADLNGFTALSTLGAGILAPSLYKCSIGFESLGVTRLSFSAMIYLPSFI